jgi:hypothetical protein
MSKPAKKFKYAYDLTGGNTPAVLPFDIATGTVIEAGEVVQLSEAKVIATSGDVTAVLGVSKDPHDGVTDGQKGLVLDVYVSPTAVFRCVPATLFTASAASGANTIKCTALAGLENDVLNGGFVKIVACAVAAHIGQVIRITDFVKIDGVITAAGTFAETTTTFLVFPPVGATTFALNSDGTNLDLADDAGTIVTIVATDPTKDESIDVMFSEHTFANAKA